MNVWPVIVRELRAEARRPLNYWLRVLGAGVMMLTFVLLVTNPRLKPAEFGPRLFSILNAMLFGATWVLTPLIMADCISREKREGTLGLLFLTPLRPVSIVLGKSLIHGWRALSLYMAMMPMLVLPFLFGGVSIKDVAMALMLNTCALMLALAAGLLASAWIKDGVRVLLFAEIMSLLLAFFFMSVHYLIFVGINTHAGTFSSTGFLGNYSPGRMAGWYYSRQPFISLLQELFVFNTGLMPLDPSARFAGRWGISFDWSSHWSAGAYGIQYAWFQWVGILAGLSLVALVVIILLAAWCVRLSWRETPVSPQQLRLFQFFCAPRFWRSIFRSKMTRLLERNPIGWLQQYAWSARSSRWGWCLGLVICECVLVCGSSMNYLWTGQFWLALLLLMALSFTAAGSFREEKETGVLELLLVTPLQEWQIISGRVRGIWGQFFPAAFVLTLTWMFLAKDQRLFADFAYYGYYANRVASPHVNTSLLCATTFLTLPIIGLYFSLRPMPFLASWLLTCGWGLLLPWLIMRWSGFLEIAGTTTNVLSIQAIVCLVTGLLLYRDLAHRRFLRNR